MDKVTDAEMAELNQLFHAKQYEACLAQAKIVLSRDPDCLGVQLILARAAIPIFKTEITYAILLPLLEKHPKHPLIPFFLATAYQQDGDVDKALIYINQAYDLVKQTPSFYELYEAFAEIFLFLGLCDEAIVCHQIIEKYKPSMENRFNMALPLLATGHYEQGWSYYELRLQQATFTKNYVQSNMPYWDGASIISGKTLLVIWEQGFGDNIQFIRFLPLLKQRTQAHIIFVCADALKRLFESLLGIDAVHTTTTLPAHDYKIYLLSLPFLLHLYQEDQFLPKPYIHANTELITQWSKHLPQIEGYHVGICWSGNQAYTYQAKRNCALSDFMPLLTHKNIQLVSLQHQLSPTDAALLSRMNLIDIGTQVQDFADLAAVIAQLDLVICIDTAIAHLAAAMGKPTWVLIRYETEWRHPRGRQHSPWYNSMRLFRQAKPGDWRSVMDAVMAALPSHLS